ncbi:MAG: histone deacetylase family protein [Pseudomonadota bacterium]
MLAFFDTRQSAHDPQYFVMNGARRPSPESPERIGVLKSGAEAAGCAFAEPGDAGLAPIAAVHDPAYLVFLKTIYARWQRIPDAGPEVVPNIHPDRRAAGYPASAVGQAGYHQGDTSCPIGPETWASAYAAAQTGLAATKAVLDGAPAAYALCRPPGHHAFADQAGGFCFLNNAAIAAQALRTAGRRPAILDIDVHHGNGTQGIFYARPDVLTISMHAEPDRFYPFFWGYPQERGAGAGLGANLNLALPRGLADDAYLAAMETAFAHIRAFAADTLVLALGLDAHENDPLKGLAITTPGFARIGAAIAGLGLPVVMVQEGGYLSPALGANLAAFLSGFQEAAATLTRQR